MRGNFQQPARRLKLVIATRGSNSVNASNRTALVGFGVRAFAAEAATARPPRRAPTKATRNPRLSMLIGPGPVGTLRIVQFTNRACVRHPHGMLKHHAIPISICVAATTRIPVWVERSNHLEPGRLHPFTRHTPLRMGRIIKNEQILRSWARRNRVPPAARKLEVIVCFWRPYDDAIETIVITEACEYA
jgi:hypothetical protein